jgi:hypothetical protein
LPHPLTHGDNDYRLYWIQRPSAPESDTEDYGNDDTRTRTDDPVSRHRFPKTRQCLHFDRTMATDLPDRVHEGAESVT